HIVSVQATRPLHHHSVAPSTPAIYNVPNFDSQTPDLASGFVLLLLKSMAARLSDVLLHGEPPKHRNAFSSPISASPSSNTWSWRQEEEEQEGEDAGD
uniref:Uncharacterized protein n=1 Tax=Triticum urartu TaxID=4572 RepID=A0A8R7P5L4_TRIUA